MTLQQGRRNEPSPLSKIEVALHNSMTVAELATTNIIQLGESNENSMSFIEHVVTG